MYKEAPVLLAKLLVFCRMCRHWLSGRERHAILELDFVSRWEVMP